LASFHAIVIFITVEDIAMTPADIAGDRLNRVYHLADPLRVPRIPRASQDIFTEIPTGNC
jgi:hypothetical protein